MPTVPQIAATTNGIDASCAMPFTSIPLTNLSTAMTMLTTPAAAISLARALVTTAPVGVITIPVTA
jgi:hypothetical protein